MKVKTFLNINAKKEPIIGTVEKCISPFEAYKEGIAEPNGKDCYYLVRFVSKGIEMRGWWRVSQCETIN